MRPVVLPDIPYGATAVRPEWADVPAAVRAAIERRLGAPVTAATSAAGGFTRTFAGVLTTGSGERVFVKAAAAHAPEAEWYARENAITAALPAGVRAARPRWTLAEAGWYVLCLAAVDGQVPRLPWSGDELEAALSAWSDAATLLDPQRTALPDPQATALPDSQATAPRDSQATAPHDSQATAFRDSQASAAVRDDPAARFPWSSLPALPDLISDHLSWWSPIAAGHVPMPEPAPDWVPGHLDELVALERALPALAAGDGVLHGDLRIDNVLIDADGHAWLCDWTWPCRGAPWFDTVTLLVTAYASGLDADALLAGWSAPAAGVDGTLAAMGGYWLVQASAPPTSASPHSAQHHRFSGTQALAWLAERRGWTTTAGPAR